MISRSVFHYVIFIQKLFDKIINVALRLFSLTNIFYIIPKLGEIESHQYLAKTSGEYADFATISDEIQALLDEIADLRRQNLELIQESTNLEDAIDPNEVDNNLTFQGNVNLRDDAPIAEDYRT